MPAADPTPDDQPEGPGPDDPDSSRADASAPGGDHAPGGITIELVLHTAEPDPPITGWLDEQLHRAVALAGVIDAHLTLAVVHDDEMARLHEQYTGVAGTTDVLTFDLNASAAGGPPPGAIALEADIVLCLDEAKRQATQRNHPVRHELLLYAVHGLMHLLGEDDHDEAGYQRMHTREDALLRELGVGPVFKTNPSPQPPDPGA